MEDKSLLSETSAQDRVKELEAEVERLSKASEMIIGWPEICRQLFPGALSTLKRMGPELRAAGVVMVSSFGRLGDPENPRIRVAWCYRTVFQRYMMLRAQKMEAERTKPENKL